MSPWWFTVAIQFLSGVPLRTLPNSTSAIPANYVLTYVLTYVL